MQEQGWGVAAISYDPPEILAAFSRQRGITFPLLSDAGSATIKRYGLLNPLVEDALGPNRDDPAVKSEIQRYVSGGRAGAFMTGIAIPGILMLDRQGRVKSRSFEDYYVERSTASSILLRLGANLAAVAATKISTAHLEITAYPSDAEVAPGNRCSLVLDIAPHPRIHVYAPGATGYRAVSFAIAPQPVLRALPTKYPASQNYFFKPLKERVPVYQKPFTLVQEVVLEGTPQVQAALREKESVTITGSLEYQACDDTTCFNPASVPITIQVRLRPLVRERPSRR